MKNYECLACGNEGEPRESWLGEGTTVPYGWHLHVVVTPQSSEFQGKTLGLASCSIKCHEAAKWAAEVACERFIPSIETDNLSFMDWVKELISEYLKRKSLEQEEEERSKIRVDKSEDM
jgi:hypothetical protein